MLGRVYWKRGLRASIAGHAIFNGLLALAAFISVMGPAHTVTRAGVTLTVPADWNVVDVAGAGPDVALIGPSGASLAGGHEHVPGAGHSDLGAIVANLNRGGAINQLLSADPGSAEIVRLPAGTGVRASAHIGEQQADVLMIPRDDEL